MKRIAAVLIAFAVTATVISCSSDDGPDLEGKETALTYVNQIEIGYRDWSQKCQQM